MLSSNLLLLFGMVWLCHSDSERLLQGRRQRGSATAFETKIFGSGRRSSSESQHNNRGKKNNTNKKNTNKKKTKASKAKPLGECSKVERKKCCRANTFGPPKTYTSAKKYCQALNCKINNCPDNKPSKANKPRPKASKAKAEKPDQKPPSPTPRPTIRVPPSSGFPTFDISFGPTSTNLPTINFGSDTPTWSPTQADMGFCSNAGKRKCCRLDYLDHRRDTEQPTLLMQNSIVKHSYATSMLALLGSLRKGEASDTSLTNCCYYLWFK